MVVVGGGGEEEYYVVITTSVRQAYATQSTVTSVKLVKVNG